ncbi:hypothetical protein V8E36_004721 [Tilletia maclaganii]
MMIQNVASVAAVVLGPLLIRKGLEFFRGGLRGYISGLRSIPSPLSGRAPPAELALLTLSLSLLTYHIASIIYIIFFPSTNRITDVFLASDTPVNAASVLLRERVAKYAQGLFERLTDTYVPAGAAADELFRRLTSFEGRKIYLMVGEEPLLYCLWCVRPPDYKMYTHPPRLASYGAHFVLFGILTLGDPTIQIVNAKLLRRGKTGGAAGQTEEGPSDIHSGQQSTIGGRYQPSRAAWRRSVLILLLTGLLGEMFTLHSLADVRNGLGRWNHWHVNILLARHALFILMTLIVYLFPTAPESVSVHTSSGEVPSAIQGAVYALNSTTASLQHTLAHLQALTLSTDVVTKDAGLRALREAKAAQVASAAAAAAAASAATSPVLPSSPTAAGQEAPNGSGAPSDARSSAAAAEEDANTSRLRQRQAHLVRLAKSVGIDVDAVRRESRETAETVLKDTERRARELERRNAELRAKAATTTDVSL